MAKLLGRSPKPPGMEGGFYVVQYDSVVLSDFLHHDIEWLADNLKGVIPDFLRGFFDAEGYVSANINIDAHALNTILVGAANTNMLYLSVIRDMLYGLGIESAIRRTNRRGQKMTIRGRTWTRRHDVFHCVIGRWEDVDKFSRTVNFENKTKAEKLADLIRLGKQTPRARYAWFTAHYQKKGHKWLKI